MNILRGALTAFLALVIVSPGIANAQQTGGQGLEISPPVLDEIQANPGQSLTAKIRLRNVSRGPLVVRGRADDFGAKGENGEPQILIDQQEATRYSLKFWVEQLPAFQLASGEARELQVRINVPANAEPGGHYGVIRFTASPPELEGTGVSLSASLGTLVLLQVAGDINHKLEVLEFSASHNAKKGSFFESGPLKFTERIRNSGSVHERPTGHVEVYNLFGKRVAQLAINDPVRNILPDSVRRFEQSLGTKSLFGRYTAKVVAKYANDQKLEAKLSFWVIPYKLIIILLIVALVIAFGVRHGIRRYNRWVIEQARRR